MDTFRAIRRVLWITMGLNLVATAAKLIVGYLTGSLSLVADGFDSVFDAASNVIGLVGIYLAARPPDEGHPYGHRKAETLTALGISALLFVTTYELIKTAVGHLLHPETIVAQVNFWSFAALGVSMVVHGAVVWYEMRAGRRLRSDLLIADARHTRADLFVSLAVGGGLVAVYFGFPLADPILAIVVALFIAKIGLDIIRETSSTLMDGATMATDEVERIATAVPGVSSCHRIRSRGHERAQFADLHLQVDPAMSVDQGHAIAHEVQRRLREFRPDLEDVTIHVEPVGSLPGNPGRERIAAQLRRLATGLGLEVHDVWAHEQDRRYHVEAHLEAPGALSLEQAHKVASSLEELALAEIPDLAAITTHIEPQGQQTKAVVAGQDEDNVARAVRQAVEAMAGLGSCHQVQVRRGEWGWVLSLHCSLPGNTPLAEAHRRTTRLEEHLRASMDGIEHVVIHTEPEKA